MSGFAPPKTDCPASQQLKPLGDSWDVVEELQNLRRYVTHLAECINGLQRQLDALQAPEPVQTKKHAPRTAPE